MLNLKLYSHYKGAATPKSLLGIAPSRVVTVISSLHAGSISDKQVAMVSGILDLRDHRDQVMVDKGLLIKDLLNKKAYTPVIQNMITEKGHFTRVEPTCREDYKEI